MRYIDADLLEPDTEWDDYKDGYMSYSDLQIRCAKTADVRENVKGKWQPIEVQPYFKKHFDTSVVCSVCHRKGNKRWNFCPNCGADMRGEKHE